MVLNCVMAVHRVVRMYVPNVYNNIVDKIYYSKFEYIICSHDKIKRLSNKHLLWEDEVLALKHLKGFLVIIFHNRG